ncbi:MAG: dockerin type I repeat-containing protein [Oscillospiraceae bacterium]|nr:dockerin type I repeat-containing protein [Oscillospiraceae bacterium]
MQRRTRSILTMTAALFAAGCVAGTQAACALTAVYAEADSEKSIPLPDWVPDTYGKALSFLNTYGGTHIEDGLLCVVFYEFQNRSPESTSVQHTVTAAGDAVQELYHETHQYSSETSSPFLTWDLEVFVYRPVRAGDFAISLSSVIPEGAYLPDQGTDISEYRFSVDDQLVITETDPYSWVPDCAQEYEDFYLENGMYAVNGNQIAFLLNYSVSYLEAGTDRITETVSSDAVQRIGWWSCAGKEATESGRSGPLHKSYQEIAVYEAVADGEAEITWTLKEKEGNIFITPVGGGWGGTGSVKTSRQIGGQFRITDHAQTVLGPGDARITIADADAGEPVTVAPGSGFSLYRRLENSDAKPLIARVTSNPFAVRKLGQYLDDDALTLDAAGFALAVPPAYGIPADAEKRGTVTKYDNGSYDVEFRLICDSAGDVNRDRILNKADVTALIQWLTASPELQIAIWDAADCNQDSILSAADLTLMKRKLLNAGASAEPDIITASTKLPVIEDETGDITDSMKAQLEETVRAMYPGSDLSDFKLVYAPDHPLTKKAGGPCFYVYYQDTLVHGLGDIDLRNNVYAAFDKNGKVTLQLLASPEAFLSVDLSGQDVSEIWMNERKKGHFVERIVYAKRDDREKPLRVAYRVIRSDVPWEQICDEIGNVIVTTDLPKT